MPGEGVLERVGHRYSNAAFGAAALAFVLFSALDCLTTATALAGGLHERNPIGASLYQHFGTLSLWALKTAVVGIIILVLVRLPRRVSVWVLTAFAVAVGIDVIANLSAGARLIS